MKLIHGKSVCLSDVQWSVNVATICRAARTVRKTHNNSSTFWECIFFLSESVMRRCVRDKAGVRALPA